MKPSLELAGRVFRCRAGGALDFCHLICDMGSDLAQIAIDQRDFDHPEARLVVREGVTLEDVLCATQRCFDGKVMFETMAPEAEFTGEALRTGWLQHPPGKFWLELCCEDDDLEEASGGGAR